MPISSATVASGRVTCHTVESLCDKGHAYNLHGTSQVSYWVLVDAASRVLCVIL